MDDKTLLTAIREIVRDELRALRLAGGHIKNVERDAADAELLRAIVATERRDSDFTAAEAVEHALLPEPEFEPLRAAIIAAVGSLDARRLGKCLRRIENAGRSISGLAVHRLRADRNGAVWKIVEA